MATSEPTSASPFFKPLPGHDSLNAAYFFLKVAEQIVVNEHGCWVWQGARTPRGYGRLDYGGRKHILHRLVYRLCVAPVGKKDEVCHNCPGGDNPSCCNPAHLFRGTHTDNMRDSEAKGRNSHPGRHGEQHGSAKLTEADVREIRRRVKAGENGQAIATEKGISRTTVCQIANRQRWAHIPNEETEGSA